MPEKLKLGLDRLLGQAHRLKSAIQRATTSVGAINRANLLSNNITALKTWMKYRLDANFQVSEGLRLSIQFKFVWSAHE